MTKKPRRSAPSKPYSRAWFQETLKLSAASIVTVTVIIGAVLASRDWILAPVRAEAKERAETDSLRSIGDEQWKQATGETLGELVVLIASRDEEIRRKTLERIQSKYIIGAIR